MQTKSIHGFNLNPIFNKYQATPEEKQLVTRIIDNNFNYSISSVEAKRDSVNLVREIKRENGIIPGILNNRPGFFWMEEYKDIRQNISNYLKEKNLNNLAEDIMNYGKEKNKGILLTDDPAVQRFLEGLKKHIAKSDIRQNLSKILLKL